MSQPAEKPPLGLMPRKLWDENRFIQVVGAIARRISPESGLDGMPLEWIDELEDLCRRIRERNI